MLQVTVLPIGVQVVVVGRCLVTIGLDGGAYGCPVNLNSGILPSEGPHAYVIAYQVTGPGSTSARRPPALLWLDSTRYVPCAGQLCAAVLKHLVGSELHLTVFIDDPSGARNSFTVSVAQPATRNNTSN